MKKIIILLLGILYISLFCCLELSDNVVSAANNDYETTVLSTLDIIQFFDSRFPNLYKGLEGCEHKEGLDEISEYAWSDRIYANGSFYYTKKCYEYIYYFEYKTEKVNTYQTPSVMHYKGTELTCRVSSSEHTRNEIAIACSAIASVETPIGSFDVESSNEYTYSKLRSNGKAISYFVDPESDNDIIYFTEISTTTVYKVVSIKVYQTTSGKYIYTYNRNPEDKYLIKLEGDTLTINYESF